MSDEPTEQEVLQFLTRVIEIEEKYAFARRGQDTGRKEDLKKEVEAFCAK